MPTYTKNLLEGVEILYVTDVQVGNAKAASFPNGNFMAISGSEWKRDDQGRVVLDKNGLPTKGTNANLVIGNREPTFSGGWNNTILIKGCHSIFRSIINMPTYTKIPQHIQ